MKQEVRCPGCGRLLAIKQENGIYEVKMSRLTLWVERADLSCEKCGRRIQLDCEGIDKQ